ncbi:hypothetical protein GQ600_12970 [Phytophthora cactorum]|nr:hypothetical protein GQ600_12970 [Phytophthora cactorum]
MEVLLLDTTEKEGEDNTLYHYVHCKQGVGCFSTSSTALKTGTTQWLDLRGVLAAAVGATTSLCGESLQCARFGTGDSTGIVGFVNIYEVLYALVFSSTDVPESIVQYYTRSSCDLVLSLFGYPDAKLNQWRRRDGGSVSTAALNADLDAVFKGVFSIIQQGEGSPTRLDTFELHDFRFARHGEYPKRHAFLLITHDNLQLACLVERKLEFEGKDDAVGWAKHLAGNVNQRYVEDLAAFCDQHLETYLKSSQALRHQRTKALQAPELQREIEYPVDDSVSIPFLWYSVALDRLRGVIISDELHNNDQKFSVHQQIMTQFVQHIAASQRSSRCLYDAIAETSPELPSGIPPLKLNVDDPDALFLREKVAADAGDDISTGDAHIFPEWCNMHMKKGREQRQTAEQIVVCGQPLWIIKNSYESLEVFSILDAALPLELVDRELDRLCAFGGAEPVQQLHSE